MRTLAQFLLVSPFEARDHAPLLRWLLLNALALFGFITAWHFGLVQLMLRSDQSYISLVILVLYGVFTAHCFALTWHISEETNIARRVRRQVTESNGNLHILDDRVVARDGRPLETCRLTHHIHNLMIKSRLQGHAKLDQTVLLHGFAEGLSGRQRLGWFVANVLFKLGLLGTIVGFILMLSPIGNISAYDIETMKTALSTMGNGMAVALFTTLAGLIGGLLLTLQYYALDEATMRLLALSTELTEVYIVPTLENRHGDTL